MKNVNRKRALRMFLRDLNPKIKLLIIGSICFQSDERQQEIEKNVTDQEQRYLKYMCKC